MLHTEPVRSVHGLVSPVISGLRPDAGIAPRPTWQQRLLQKIETAPFETEPFRHLHIRNFFDEGHFARIVSAPEVAIHGPKSDEDLFDALFARGYESIDFPGCVTNKSAYIKWRRRKDQHAHGKSVREGFGMALRLVKAESPIMKELIQFMESAEFQDALARKFGIDRSLVTYDSGIEKYLDGYEVSPHPGIRRKALTYLVNVNPGKNAGAPEPQTCYLRLKDQYQYVRAYWEGNPDADRCWVPWSWCETVKQQRENNSIVAFSPASTTMHGAKARYDHLASQHTQLHGNFWYRPAAPMSCPEWEDLVIRKSRYKLGAAIKRKLGAAVPPNVKSFIEDKILHRGENAVILGDRWKKVIG
jgi:hypothetical protein